MALSVVVTAALTVSAQAAPTSEPDPTGGFYLYFTSEQTFGDSVALEKQMNPGQAQLIDDVVEQMSVNAEAGLTVEVPHETVDDTLVPVADALAEGTNNVAGQPLLGSAASVGEVSGDSTGGSGGITPMASGTTVNPAAWNVSGYGAPTTAPRYSYWTEMKAFTIGAAWCTTRGCTQKETWRFRAEIDPGVKTSKVTRYAYYHGPTTWILTKPTSNTYAACSGYYVGGYCGKAVTGSNTSSNVTYITTDRSMAGKSVLHGITWSVQRPDGQRLYVKARTGTAGCGDTNCYYAP